MCLPDGLDLGSEAFPEHRCRKSSPEHEFPGRVPEMPPDTPGCTPALRHGIIHSRELSCGDGPEHDP